MSVFLRLCRAALVFACILLAGMVASCSIVKDIRAECEGTHQPGWC